MRSSVNRIALGTIIGEQPWRKMLAADKAKRAPMLGDYAWSCGSWSLYSATGNIPMALSEAIIATYMTIHMARSPGSHSGRIACPCQEFREGAEILRVWLSGNESARSLEAKAEEFSVFAAHSWASGTRDWN